MQTNIAAVRLVKDGVDLTDKVNPRLESLTLTEAREEAADKLEFTLTNHDGKLAPIVKGAVLTLELGWLQGSDVTAGMVNKGRFTVDEVEKSGPPDKVTVRARSADLTGGYRKRKDRSWRGKTIGELVSTVARENGLTPRVHADLAGIRIESAEQAAKSDMTFIRDLGRRHDAIATVKHKSLIFMPIGTATTASGAAMPALTLTRRQGWTWRFSSTQREEHDGAEAQWQDKATARRKTARHGGTANPKRIKKTFSSKAEAKAAAKAQASRDKRGTHEFSYELALGDPAISPNQRVTLTGWDTEIDGIKWLVKEASHRFDGGSGLLTSLEMESAA